MARCYFECFLFISDLPDPIIMKVTWVSCRASRVLKLVFTAPVSFLWLWFLLGQEVNMCLSRILNHLNSPIPWDYHSEWTCRETTYYLECFLFVRLRPGDCKKTFLTLFWRMFNTMFFSFSPWVPCISAQWWLLWRGYLTPSRFLLQVAFHWLCSEKLPGKWMHKWTHLFLGSKKVRHSNVPFRVLNCNRFSKTGSII